MKLIGIKKGLSFLTKTFLREHYENEKINFFYYTAKVAYLFG